jgi:2-amino-1-hydroxyethylphosphonate dioxygenase (glycine-forming)
MDSTDKVIDLYSSLGNADYVGEKVSQVAHGTQAAYWAKEARGDDVEIIAAALLHDVGHLLGIRDNLPRMKSEDSVDLGAVMHEVLGANWLRELGFPERVARLVQFHVNAKRYLCCVDPSYYEKLSDASKGTLKCQGGPMTPEEAKAFENSDDFEDILALRVWDEKAKDPSREVPSLESYRTLLQSMITSV